LEDGAAFTTLLDDNSEQLTIDKHSTPGRVIVVGANRAAYIISPNIEDEKVHVSICTSHFHVLYFGLFVLHYPLFANLSYTAICHVSR
jgi:hypothetical protein